MNNAIFSFMKSRTAGNNNNAIMKVENSNAIKKFGKIYLFL